MSSGPSPESSETPATQREQLRLTFTPVRRFANETAAPSALGLRVLSVCLGIFFLFMGLDKLPWLGDPGLLTKQLNDWLQTAPAPSRWYLRTIAIPGAPVFAYLVLAGELAAGGALLVGFKPHLAALAGLVMVVNFHFAMGVLLQFSYLWNGYGPPVLGGLLALVIGGARLPFSVSRPRDRDSL